MPGIGDLERNQIVAHIQSSIQNIDELINDLNIILAAKSDINSKKEIVEFSDVIKHIKSILEKQFSESKTKLKLSISDEAGSIYSIRSYLKSIIYNLLNNAMKYRSQGTETIVSIDITKQGSFIQILIQDNGIGIDLEKHGTDIFGLYKRFHTNFEGKGLGLNMTKTQIESLGGSISVESTPKVGTQFKIMLPIQDETI
jgi:signal transduction histidine kinase